MYMQAHIRVQGTLRYGKGKVNDCQCSTTEAELTYLTANCCNTAAYRSSAATLHIELRINDLFLSIKFNYFKRNCYHLNVGFVLQIPVKIIKTCDVTVFTKLSNTVVRFSKFFSFNSFVFVDSENRLFSCMRRLRLHRYYKVN